MRPSLMLQLPAAPASRVPPLQCWADARLAEGQHHRDSSPQCGRPPLNGPRSRILFVLAAQTPSVIKFTIFEHISIDTSQHHLRQNHLEMVTWRSARFLGFLGPSM
jgi:hypothetical protein